ncbi:hypothetical protein F4827_003259 [Paraburkholderia bannensis]|uniref:DUF4280 domain-containing protein n=1 Tax=Paraburkholderia bannensis TaxID=765414 RepID=A0A7W9TYC6_9BURK|nr:MULTISPECIES: DUF4280 domain-containing protein [Paraburkholderia]MBB3258391.1 hypothetical protein [Paraburkholderia sp. WP4_3_2]MBB6103404.1 hypothetical protein [Paraburkholderia bannensis]
MSCPQVCSGATLQCSFGAAPGVLNVLPVNRVMAGAMPAATVMDNVPILNIAPFAMCQSPSNPAVIAATAAALGVLTPMPCLPAIAAPWIPGGAPTVLIGSMPALDVSATLVCMWGGVIKVVQPGQMTVLVP